MAEPDGGPRLALMTRAGCHLCETAAATLRTIAAEAGLEPLAVDVDADPGLQAEYGDRVPVVLLDGREHSYFEVDVPRLRGALGLSCPVPGPGRSAAGPQRGAHEGSRTVASTTAPPVRAAQRGVG